jgi:asparagine synthase (glutamine-hydrolysing)
LFGARDHFGLKPFYYNLNKEKLIFASEIKALLVHPEIVAKPNEKIVWDFLMADFLDHTPQTFFDGIKELWGGHYFMLENGRMKIKKYYDTLDIHTKLDWEDDARYEEKFKELVFKAVQERLPVEGPMAATLSGGLDSSSIVCVADRLLKENQKQHTFSARFKDKKLDENDFIKSVVKQTKVVAHDIFPNDSEIQKNLSKIFWAQEMPFSGTSICAQWNVYREISKSGVKVLLEGVGSDVLLAGYTGLIGIYIVQLFKEGKIGRALRELYFYGKLHGSIVALLKELFIKAIHFGFFGKTLAKFVREKNWPEYALFKPEFLSKYTTPGLTPYDKKNVFNNGMINNYFLSLNPVLRWEDRNINAFGISVRLPFVDHFLVEYGFTLPDNQKIRDGQTKWILRQALKGVLPEKVRNRHDKIGFTTPEDEWFRGGMKNEMLAVFESESFANRGYFDGPKTVELFKQYLEGKIHNHHLFWRLYSLEMWFRMFIDKKAL